MPRTKVPPGSCSKRSCSSASSWRAANLSCCATSVSARPRSSRARASSAPTPLTAAAAASVILAPLQQTMLGRRRKAPAQLDGERLLGDALAQAALDAQREPERLGARVDELVVARHQAARLVDVALAIADLAQP